MIAGVLLSTVNTGQDSELAARFKAPLSIDSNKPVFASDTVSLKRRVLYSEFQRWEIETGLFSIDPSYSDLLVNIVMAGHGDPVYVRMPQMWRGDNHILNGLDFRVTGQAAAGVSSVSANLAGQVLPKGEFIRFSGHAKVYVLTAPSNGTLSIFPKLTKPVAANERVYYGNMVTLTCLYDSQTRIGISFSDGIMCDVNNVKLIESLE